MKEYNFIENGYKKGDRVWSIEHGWEIIKLIDVNRRFPIQTHDRLYSAFGRKFLEDLWPTIYPNSFTIPDSAYIPELRDKQLIWACDSTLQCRRVLGFYDKENDTVFRPSGSRGGFKYKFYEAYKGKWPEWAVEAEELLAD